MSIFCETRVRKSYDNIWDTDPFPNELYVENALTSSIIFRVESRDIVTILNFRPKKVSCLHKSAELCRLLARFDLGNLKSNYRSVPPHLYYRWLRCGGALGLGFYLGDLDMLMSYHVARQSVWIRIGRWLSNWSWFVWRRQEVYGCVCEG